MYFFIFIDFDFFLLLFLDISNERNDRMYFSIFLDFDKQKQAKTGKTPDHFLLKSKPEKNKQKKQKQAKQKKTSDHFLLWS